MVDHNFLIGGRGFTLIMRSDATTATITNTGQHAALLIGTVDGATPTSTAGAYQLQPGASIDFAGISANVFSGSENTLFATGNTGTSISVLHNGTLAPAQIQRDEFSVDASAFPGDVTLTVRKLPYDGGSAITAIQYSTDGTTWASLGTGPGSVAISPGDYGDKFTVRAVNAIGSGPAAPFIYTRYKTVPNAPDDWEALTGTKDGGIIFALNNLPPRNGSNITAMRYSLDDGSTSHALRLQDRGQEQIIADTSRKMYDAVISAQNSSGWGPWSAPLSVLSGGESAFYTSVSPIALSAISGSLQFPSGNYRTGSFAAAKMGAIWQPSGYITLTLPGVVFYMELGLDLRKRVAREVDFAYTDAFGIMGNGWGAGQTFGVRLRDANNTTSPNCFEIMYQGSGGDQVNLITPEWTEDECALFCRITQSGSNETWEFGWIGRDGVVHSTSAVKNANSLSALVGSGYAVGAILSSGAALTADGAAASPTLFWPGRIGRVLRTGYDGVTATAVDTTTVADLQALYAGASVQTQLATAIAAKRLRYYRDFGAGLTAPFDYTTGATGIADTGTAYITGATTTRKGTPFPRAVGSKMRFQTALPDGMFYGVMRGQTSRGIDLAVSLTGHDGTAVEVQVVHVDDGTVAADWQTLGTLASGLASGTIRAPVSRGGGFLLRARTADEAASFTLFDRIFVGYAIGLLGQSQCDNAMAGGTQGYSTALTVAGNSVFLTNDWIDDDNGTPSAYPGAAKALRIGVVGDYWLNRGPINAFVNQMKAFTDAPICLVDLAVKETKRSYLYADTGSNVAAGTGSRSWAQLRDKIDFLGPELACVVDQWVTSDMTETAYADMIEELYHGGTSLAGVNSLTDILAPGFRYAYMPPTRHVWTGATDGSDNTYITNPNARRAEGVARAQSLGLTVGPPSPDYMIESAGGPHADSTNVMGSPLLMVRAAQGAARAMGLDTSQNPSWGAAVRSGATITITPVLPNGGTLTSPAPTALRSWKVNGSYTGFTAAISGGAVVLTKSSGSWAAGDVVEFQANGQGRAAGNATEEAAIIAGFCYETWSKDILGLGIPVTGQIVDGKWQPAYSVTVA